MKANWQQQSITCYQITSQIVCFCPSTDNISVTISNDQITEAFYETTGVYLTDQELSWLKTVNEHFDIIEDAIREDVFSLNVEYDPTFSYPTIISIDYIKNVAVDEITYRLSNLQ